MKSKIIVVLLLLLVGDFCLAQTNTFPVVTKNEKASIIYDGESTKLDSIAANLLADDIERVTSARPIVMTDIAKAKGNVIVIGGIRSRLIQQFIGGNSSVRRNLVNKWECFAFKTINKPLGNISKAFVIAGSDARGTAYGVFTLSEKIGVSPWFWWADVPVKKQKELVITQNDLISAPPSVRFRGIFINDEDWGLQPWAAKTLEPETGDIGPKTYAKVFELLLRLKANMIWPAMHPSTKAFFHYPGNIKTAEDYQITIGSSHAEPMLRNNVGEWNEKTMGRFNYFTNKEAIYKYWEERIKESKGINAIYSLGMRGVHDGQMEGIRNLKEAVPVVEKIIQDEREMLSRYINKDVTNIPQVLTPYKEVLEIYDYGLKVPDDVTLVWPDDNYGYIHRLNNEKEILRKGGAGVYYHASYWGRPHDYLWISSTHPALIREEMMKAYETGADRLWVLNVGDIKPLEYNMQLFLDMAYNSKPFRESSYTKKHLKQWAKALFGKEKATAIADILWQYYALAFERRPEFMGWSQTEPETKTTYTQYNHFYFGDEAQQRINSYDALETAVRKLRSQVDVKYADAFYQLVYYPVVAASYMNKKFLYRDKAYFYSRQNRLSAYSYAQLSGSNYDSIVKETEFYNSRLANGKWNHIISMKPRNLAVYLTPVIPDLTIDSTGEWGIAPEGFVTKDSSLLQNIGSLSLPAFDNLNKQKYFIDIFLSKKKTIKWKTSASGNWIRVSQNGGVLDATNNQLRIWVDVDWSKLKGEKEDGNIVFSAGDKEISVAIGASKKNVPGLAGMNSFIENNGFLSFRAAHFSRRTNKLPNQWKLIDGLGYSDHSLQAMPLSVNSKAMTDPDSIKLKSAAVEYDFYTFSSGSPVVTVFTLPTHPLNNSYGVRYALSIDDGALKVVDTKTFGRSEEWKQNVLRNRAERKIELPYLDAGKHRLKIYCIDPGVVLDEIRIDFGGLRKAYGTIAETRLSTKKLK